MSREKTCPWSTESPKLENKCSNLSPPTMSHPHRRLSRQHQKPQQYSAVPQTSPSRHGSSSSSQQQPYHYQQVQPPQHPYHYQQNQPPSQQYIPYAGGPRSPPPPRLLSVQRNAGRASGRVGLTMGVASGAVGAGYGPYSVGSCILRHETSKIFYLVQPHRGA